MKQFKRILLSSLATLIAITVVNLNPVKVLALNYNETGNYYNESINQENNQSLKEESFNKLNNDLV